MPSDHLACAPLPNYLPRTSPENAYINNVEALAATGSTQADAALIVSASGAVVHGTAADGTKGIKLPPITDIGQTYTVKNSDAANAVLKVYPSTGATINSLSANAAISMAAKTPATFIAISATAWNTIPLLPS